MPSRPSVRRASLLIAGLGLLVSAAAAGLASAAAPPALDGPAATRGAVASPAGVVAAARSRSIETVGPADPPGTIDGRGVALVRARIPVAIAPDWIERPDTDTPAARPRSVAATVPGGTATTAPAGFTGRNRMWMPALGIKRSVSFFSCSSNAYPGDRVYRWGCAGRNNVYLFGHAHSVFEPLHDAYVSGRLAKGMVVHYADGDGDVSTYAVRWWKVVKPDQGGFAYAAQSTPSLTLQTCVGADSQYRLVVRLVKVG